MGGEKISCCIVRVTKSYKDELHKYVGQQAVWHNNDYIFIDGFRHTINLSPVEAEIIAYAKNKSFRGHRITKQGGRTKN